MRALLLAGLLPVLACRGDLSTEPPVHLVRDMDRQPRVGPQRASPFFPDGRSMRPPVEGTVARGDVLGDPAFQWGKVEDRYVAVAPVSVNVATLARGEERFNIHCAPCHDRAGGGRGLVVRKGYPPALDLASERARRMSDGQIFDTIRLGVRNMPARGYAMPPAERWDVVVWVRALQRSQHASLADLTAAERADLGVTEGRP